MAITSEKVTLSGDDEIMLATSRLLQCCHEEYDYYDGLPESDPNSIEPYDVLATVSMNSYITNATQMRKIHRGMVANCSAILPAIPSDSNLLTCSPSIIVELGNLLFEAVQVSGVLIPVATKILHRKRKNLIPMLDNVVLEYYLTQNGLHDLLGRTQDKRHATSVAMKVLDLFRQHLQSFQPQIEFIRGWLAQEDYTLTPVRILELLVWITVEPRGYYRNE